MTKNSTRVRSLSRDDIRAINSKKDVKSYVSQAKLSPSPLPTALARTETENQESGKIVAQDLVAFTKGVPIINRFDVAHSILFAQQVANFSFNRREQPSEWYTEFEGSLSNLAWIVQDFNFVDLQLGASNVTIDKVVLQVLGGIASGQEIENASSILEGMKAAGSDEGVVLWEFESHTDHAGGFHLGSATFSDGMILYNPSVFHFTTTRKIEKLLFFEFSSQSATVNAAATTLAFDLGIYGMIEPVWLDWA